MTLRKRSEEFGFTLIELMVVVTILTILAGIAFAKYGDLLRKAREGETKGNLGAIRSAISIYYGDMDGQYPADLLGLSLNKKYIASIPPSYAPDYHQANAHFITSSPCPIKIDW